MKLLRLAVVAFLLAACNGNDDGPAPNETVYDVAGVRVVVENENGPKQTTMLLASEVYRREAIEYLEIDADVDEVIWQEVAEIRWADGLVPPIGGQYDAEAGKILLEYHGCIVDPPLFQMLMAHYHYQLTGETEQPAEDVTWAEELSAANTVLCAR